MDYAEKNRSVLQELRPKLYEKLIEREKEQQPSFDSFEKTETRDGNWALCIKNDGKVNRMNSTYRPAQEAKKWADQFTFQNMNIITILYGLGNGIFLGELLKRLDADAKVFVCEPDFALFCFCIENFDMEDVLKDERVQIYVDQINLDGFAGALERNVHWTNLPSQILSFHPNYDKVYIEQYKDFLAAVENANKMAKVNRDTEAHLAHSAVSNVMKNLHFIKDSNYIPDLIEKIPDGVPAIVVAAGPSLDKNIDQLKNAKGKAFILATDTAVKYLLMHDAPFDAIITLDAKKSPRHLTDERCEQVPIFSNVEAKNLFLEKNRSRKIWFRSEPYTEALYSEFGREFPPYSSGGSVATGAFSTCAALGFKKIVLIGQDLAYDGDVTHAGGVEKHIVNESYGMKMVDGVNGGKVRSRYDWLIYKDWFEDAIRALPEIEVIDATEGGALIEGSKVRTLADVIKKECKKEFDFAAVLEETGPTFSAEEYTKVKEKMLHLEKEFVLLRGKATEGKKAQEDLMKLIRKHNTSAQKEEKCLKTIRKVNNVIAKQSAYNLLDTYITGMTTEKVQQINMLSEDADQNMLQTLAISGAVYTAMIEAIDELTPLLKESLAKL